MKTRFNTVDIVRGVTELQELIGLRLNQVYDINTKTFLLRLQGNNEIKKVILIESGIRFHPTVFEWPKNVAPSGFTMKLRKHLKNKRLETFQQMSFDRIVDFQFGTSKVAYHVILELYDRGNIILADHEYTIMHILRPHTHGEQIKYGLWEKYPMGHARMYKELTTEDEVRKWISAITARQDLRGALMHLLDCGSTLIEHVLIENKLENRCIMGTDSDKTPDANANADAETEIKATGKQRRKKGEDKLTPLDMDKDIPALLKVFQLANDYLMRARTTPSAGYIIQKAETGVNASTFLRNIEYQPYLYAQYRTQPHLTFNSFMEAVDEYYSSQEGQKIDLKTFQLEREAMKKLTNIRNDHTQRLDKLNEVQELDKRKAEVIICNQDLVAQCILAIQTLIANQMPWPIITEHVKKAQSGGDPIARCIKSLKLETNQISLELADPYNSDDDDDDEETAKSTHVVDIDLALSAWANARRYYDDKRNAANKEKKTIDASQKALKSAERKAQQTLKEVRAISNIVKARKVYWFEKFYWFISSENYLVIGGRDAQQNELIVKRYMRATDIYVHAEVQGASSIVICNPQGGVVSPKTLLEAGTMAISYSVAWDAKILTNCYWVHATQVSKTAPSGEYLSTGSFLIRGKKNFLPPCNFVMGLGVVFKLEDSFIEKHANDRKEKSAADIELSSAAVNTSETEEAKKTAEQLENSLEDLNLSDDQSVEAFPNIEIKIEHFPASSTELNAAAEQQQEEEISESIITASQPTKIKQVNAKKQKKLKLIEPPTLPQCDVEQEAHAQPKRGKQSKLKKIKAKYRDQDEEERDLRMKILSSAGKDTGTEQVTASISAVKSVQAAKQIREGKAIANAQDNRTIEVDGVDDDVAARNTEIIDELTGQPHEDDELIFAVPVVAPYQALQQFKYKVKLTPGTGKRGKAAKAALFFFTKDKCCTAHEKNLIKSIKDEAVARNIPGKVKLSGEVMKLKTKA